MTNYDYYEETRALIFMVSNTPLDIYASKLQRAMDEGATGTEIFMAIRWNLENLLNEKDCNDLIRAKAKRLWEEINKALG